MGIIGGGFAGLAAAIAFREDGHTVSVFERSSGPSAAGGAISLAPNALTCLSILGVRAHVVTDPWSQTPATVRSSDGDVLIRRTLAQLTGGDQYATVPRGQLLTWLTERLPPECLHYCSTVTGVRPDGGVVVAGTEQRFDLIVGADGTRGLTRGLLGRMRPQHALPASRGGPGSSTGSSTRDLAQFGGAPPTLGSCPLPMAARTFTAEPRIGEPNYTTTVNGRYPCQLLSRPPMPTG